MIFFGVLLTSGFPNFMVYEAHAAYTGMTFANIADGNRISADASVDYRLINDGTGNADAGTITFVRTGGTADGSTHTYTLVSGDLTASTSPGTLHQKTITQLEADGGFADLVSGTVYTVSVVITGTAASTVSKTSVTYDETKPTMSSATVTGTNTIDVTFSEDIIDAEASDFTLDGGLTVASVSETDGVVTITTNETIESDATPTVTLGGDFVQDVINVGTANTADAGTVTATANNPDDGGGSGCDTDCEEPTLGVLPNGKRIVDDGFTYNGHSVDVERFFTPYPLITAQVGKQNTAQFKIYDNRGPDNIAHFSFAFGLGKGEVISQSQVMIEVDFARDRTQTTTITDPQNALDNVSVTTDKVACNDGPTQCLGITINHTFREPLDFNIVGTDVWDYSRQSWHNYYNHGIEVVGISMNPAEQYDGIDRGQIYHLTETGKNTAVDEFGDSWTFQYGIWMKDYIKQDRIQDEETLVFDRMHSDFAEYRENLSNEAMNDLLEICPLCIEQYADFEDSTSWEYGNKISKQSNPEIQMLMTVEEQKAQEIMKRLLDVKYDLRNAYLGIEKDDRPIAEILEEERINKVMLQAERDWLKQIIVPSQ